MYQSGWPLLASVVNDVSGMYEGRPERYFDNKDDPRRRTTEVEDSDHTRQVMN